MFGQRLFEVVLLIGQAVLLIGIGLNIMNQDSTGSAHLPRGLDVVVAGIPAFDLG